tara:strand:+ start:2734 stop:3201 length:468 start_codon:yes stop_codon:yes gene_type:complete
MIKGDVDPIITSRLDPVVCIKYRKDIQGKAIVQYDLAGVFEKVEIWVTQSVCDGSEGILPAGILEISVVITQNHVSWGDICQISEEIGTHFDKFRRNLRFCVCNITTVDDIIYILLFKALIQLLENNFILIVKLEIFNVGVSQMCELQTILVLLY